jgi:membrane-associated protease RseP (regulator of RpoE activity)
VNGEEPLEITTFYPRDVEVIDARRRNVSGSYLPRRSVRSNRRVALVLFLATCASVFLAGLVPGGGLLQAVGELQAAWQRGIFWPVWQVMARDGALYFFAVMTILIAHEMGHFLQAKRYRVPATVPYFIPFPITPFGTMGAVIIQGAGVANRKSLFDIAISGPLAGLVFALPITAIGVQQADFIRVEPGQVGAIFNDPLVLQWMSRWIHGPMPEHHELHLNALLFAGWVGIFITALNLMPIGQLDGGHILYTLIGRRAHRVALGLLAAAITFMFWTQQVGYALMVVLLFVAGPRHPPTANDNMPLGAGRIALGWLTLAFVIIGFTPVPISLIPDVERKPSSSPRVHSESIEVQRQPSLVTRPSGSS